LHGHHWDAHDTGVIAPDTRYAKAPDGAYIAYQVLGEGSIDLLWLEGERGNLEVMWEHPLVSGFYTKLARGCRLIRFDMRGTGLSDRGERSPTLEAQVDDARVVCDIVGSQRTAIAGHGWGCAAAAVFASTFPKRTTHLILAAAQARNRWSPEYPWGFTDEEFARFRAALETGWGTDGYAAMVAAYASASLVEDRDYLRWLAKVQRHWVGPSAAIAIEQQFYDSDITDVLRTVRVPTLIVARGWEMPEEDEYVAALIPHAALVRLPGDDWMMWAGDQEPVVDAIHTFLEAPSAAPDAERSLATLLFTDIVASTERAGELGDRAWGDLLKEHHAVVRSALRRYHGQEVDTAGDGFFATFDGPARAVRCAEDIIRSVENLGLRVRAGVHTGEVEVIDGKVGGIAVHIGARVGALAGPSEVLVSQTVKDLVAGSGLRFEDAGEHYLKGVEGSWRLFRVVDGSDAVSEGDADR
jgi:class 3 adenylate cyclase